MDSFLEKVRNTAIAAAKAAGYIQLHRYGKSQRVDCAMRHDIKIEVDSLCERVIIDRIKAGFPEHSIITEESGGDKNESEYVWIVDPLDGTVNFCHGIPYFSSSVACYHLDAGAEGHGGNGLEALGKPVVGVVYAPILDELFVGIEGCQATCNGTVIKTGIEQELQEAVICTSFGSSEKTMRRMEKLNGVLLRRARKIRILGSTGLDIANVACGRISGLLQGCVRNWDFAAARIVLEQSGGTFHARENANNQWEIVASTPGLYRPLTALMNEK
jgi:fructose-1,6-bisphosphatase/inositol monophosphatase family enzyme